ncbi:MAG: penicillin-binding protein 1A [Alphaproteobacteria bacterium]|nr:penicillin-binding protein 1A [Alphaproteobacteria bacterium]
MRAPIQPPPKKKPKKRRKRSLLLGFLGFGFAAAVVLFVVGSAVAGYMLMRASEDLPNYEKLAEYSPPVMTRIHANDGSLIAEYARERRIFVPINTVPKVVIAAFLSAEDKRFYEHGGLDFQGIARAVFKLVLDKAQGRRARVQGASTITQQVAKNFLLTSDRTLDRKLKEAILAIRIERTFSKDKILELYLNEIYFGIGSYGVAAAGLNYFDKELKDLTIEEAAYLAALPKAPNNYHPRKHTEKALIRRNWIIGQMYQNGYITKEEAEQARAKPIGDNIRSFGTQILAADFFAEEVRRALLAQYGEQDLYGGGMSVRTTLDPKLQHYARKALIDGLVTFDRRKGWRGPHGKIDIAGDWGATLYKVEAPGDLHPWKLGVVLSSEADTAVVGLKPRKGGDGKLIEKREAVQLQLKHVNWAKKVGGGKKPKQVSDVLSPGDVVFVSPVDPLDPTGAWELMQIPEVGGGIVAMDPHTGRVLAVVGGFSFDISQFDRAIQAKRQPGSSFKPFVYAAALDNGYKPTSIVLDAPIEIEQGPGQDVWKPENYNKSKSYGPTTLRIGIEKSRNQMTVRLAQDMGMPLITEYAKRFGIYDDLLPVLSMSLGAGETTLLRMATAYCILANGGKRVYPTLIDRIQDRWGKSIWRHDQRTCEGCKAESWAGQEEPEIPDDRRQIIDPHTSYQMTSILQGVVQRGTARSLKKLGIPLAGKTGTTNEEKDAWFVGYAPDLVVGVFVGYDTPRPMGKGMTGGQVSAPIFGEFVKMAMQGKPVTPFRQPPGIKLVRVNSKTGLRATPGDKTAIMEAYKPFEGPDDEYSVIGLQGGDGDAFTNQGAASSSSTSSSYSRAERPPVGNVGTGSGGLW